MCLQSEHRGRMASICDNNHRLCEHKESGNCCLHTRTHTHCLLHVEYIYIFAERIILNQCGGPAYKADDINVPFIMWIVTETWHIIWWPQSILIQCILNTIHETAGLRDTNLRNFGE